MMVRNSVMRMPVKRGAAFEGEVCRACPYKSPKLCPWCEHGGREVNVAFEGGAVMDVLPITGYLQKVEVMWKGQAVTKVPVGESFHLRATTQATNPGGGNWEVRLTGIEIPAGTGDWYKTATNLGTLASLYRKGSVTLSTNQGPGYFDMTDTGELVMPNRDVFLRVRFWGYPFTDGPDFDSSLW